MFRVPDSDDSAAPSTPDRGRRSFAMPSTTPAGPPPGQSRFGPSSTPAGAPPTLFGGARPNFQAAPYTFSNSLFGSSPPKHDVPESSGIGRNNSSKEGQPYKGRYDAMDEDGEGEEDEEMDGSAEDEQHLAEPLGMRDAFSQSFALDSTYGESRAPQKLVRSGAKVQEPDLLSLAKGVAPNADRATLSEPDDTILRTERILEELHASLDTAAPASKNEALADAAQELLTGWRASSSKSLSSAAPLAELLLGIYHPGRVVSQKNDLSASQALAHPGQGTVRCIPQVLSEWLNTHRPAEEELDDVFDEVDGYSHHPLFWEAVLVTVMRGRFQKTIDLLNGANFTVAHTAEEDEGMPGYRGPKLRYAQQALQEAVLVLGKCPALINDWNVKGHDWKIFRQLVRQAKRELEDLAEGDSKSKSTLSQSLRVSQFALSQSRANFNLSTHSRKVECKVPWSVYEELLKMYNLLSGDEYEILTMSSDWIDAAISLTIWWDGEEDETAQGSFSASRHSLVQSRRSSESDTEAYTGRLSACLATTMNNGDEEFELATSRPFEVGLACILDNNVEGVLHIFRKYSLTVASAVAEIASAGGWFKHDDLFGQLDQSDLLLSYNQPSRTGLSKDDLLVSYAGQVSLRKDLSSQDRDVLRTGWELAIRILGRLDDTRLATQRIQTILDDLPLTTAEQVDKVTQLCHSMSLSDQALGISLKYADYLHTNTQNYGDAILYYARAHAAPKIQEVLRTLVAHCLVKSVAYPPLSELDASLRKLVTFPKKTLTELAALDSEAAGLLSNYLSGYATIRKYYDLRDEEVLLKEGEKPAHRPLARKRTAANALMVIISSASSSIRGGLYDPDVETVVQVDVLLSLLGEALVFINQPKRWLTLRHLYDLLAAVEDLTTAPSMIQAQCEEALRTTLAAAHENSPRSLNKSTSNLTTASSQYSLIGSIDLGSFEGVSTESSTVLVKGGGVDEVKRGWDWRKGFPRGAKGEDVLRIMRLGIAQELARAFAEGDFKP